jgi:hypothetical protein
VSDQGSRHKRSHYINKRTTADGEPRIDARDLLNAQTGRISWTELQRHFARGVVIVVDPDLDLIDVAARMVEDNTDPIRHWTEMGRLARADTGHAKSWEASQAQFWAVVVAPWVLVQEIMPD